MLMIALLHKFCTDALSGAELAGGFIRYYRELKY
jgi:hypothetical protein